MNDYEDFADEANWQTSKKGNKHRHFKNHHVTITIRWIEPHHGWQYQIWIDGKLHGGCEDHETALKEAFTVLLNMELREQINKASADPVVPVDPVAEPLPAKTFPKTVLIDAARKWKLERTGDEHTDNYAIIRTVNGVDVTMPKTGPLDWAMQEARTLSNSRERRYVWRETGYVYQEKSGADDWKDAEEPPAHF